MATAASVASKGPLITGALASATVEGGPGAPPRLHKAKHYPTEDVIIARLDVDANVEAVRKRTNKILEAPLPHEPGRWGTGCYIAR